MLIKNHQILDLEILEMIPQNYDAFRAGKTNTVIIHEKTEKLTLTPFIVSSFIQLALLGVICKVEVFVVFACALFKKPQMCISVRSAM